MNNKTAKRLRRLSEIKESDPSRQRKFYQNAKRKFKKANVWMKTQLNKLMDKELKPAI